MAGIFLTILLVFIGDIMTPLGYAEAILYLVPLLLSSFLYNPHLPIRIAGLATLLVAVGFVLSPPGAPVAYALLNRTMVAIVLWTVAFGLRQIIRDRQTHLHEEQRWRLLAHQTNDILWDWDLRTNAHWWSDNAKTTFGYDPLREPSIEAWHSRLHPDDHTRIQTSIQSAIASGRTGWSEEYQFRIYGNTYHTFLDRGTILRDGSGTALRMIGAMADITTQTLAARDNARLAASRLLLLESTGDGIYGIDLDGRCTFANQAAARMFGTDADSLRGRDIHHMHHRRNSDGTPGEYADCPIHRTLRTGQSATATQDVFLRTDGQTFPVQYSSHPIFEAGTVTGAVVIFSDISATQHLQAALRRSEERLTLATHGSTDALWDGHRLPGRAILDPENPIWWSARIRAILAIDESEVFDTVGHWATRLHPDDAERALTALRNHFEHRQPFDIEYRIRTGHGTYRWLRARGQAIWDSEGEPQRMSGSCQDITDRKTAELALQQSEHQLKEAHRIAHLGTWELDHESQALTWSEEIYRIFGIQPDQFEPSYAAFLALVHPDDRNLVHENYLASLANCTHYDIVHRILRPDGQIAFVREQCETQFAADGRPLISTGTAQDITELKRTEEALRESEQRKTAVLNAALDCIITIDCEQRVIEFNPAAETTFGYTREQVLGKPIGTLVIPPSLREQHQRGMAHYLATGNGPFLDRRVEITAMKADGTEFPVELSLTRISNHAGPLFTAFIRDITERKRTEDSLRNSEARLNEAQRIAQIGSWEWDIATGANIWSDETFRIFGYVPGSLAPSYDIFMTTLHADERTRTQDALRATLQDHAPYDLICRIVRPSGEEHAIRCRGEVTRNQAGTPIRMAGTVEDVTDRTRADDQLRQAYAQLQDVTRHAAAAEENERRRIAREIHDELGQLLTAMRFQLTSLKKQRGASAARDQARDRDSRLNDLLDLSDSMLNQVRHLSTSLRPAILDELGLIPAVQAHARQFEIRTGIACDVVVDPALTDCPFDDATSSSVFRIIQELLTNVLRHAQAMAVTVSFATDGPSLTVTVHDNGSGIEPEQERRHHSFGLKGISERAALLGGTFAIGPSPAEGTVATLRFPMSVLSPAPPHQEDHENPVGR